LNILLVEDQQLKAKEAIDCLSRLPADVTHVTSFVDAKRCMKSSRADLLVLDMSLPVHTEQASSTAPVVYGGEELLKWAYPRIPVPPTIVFTQFDSFADRGVTDSLDTLYQRLKQDYPTVVIGSVRYGVGLDWAAQLLRHIEAFIKKREA
jgi:CheY-like chemotaxis protein